MTHAGNKCEGLKKKKKSKMNALCEALNLKSNVEFIEGGRRGVELA